MQPLDFAIGIGMGLAIAAPLGPVNIVAIRATLRCGLAGGLAAGAGAVVADSAFAAVAAFGLQWIADLFSRYAVPIAIVGGLLLVVIGVRTALTHVSAEMLREAPEAAAPHELARLTATTISTTITNPGALLGVLAVFGAMGDVLAMQPGWADASLVVAGFAAGGGLWWLGLSVGIHRLRQRLSARFLDRVNRWTGLLVAAFGFVLLLKAVGY